jgi:GrxC family glutaredoxin
MNRIEIYTRSWCPYSVRAKALLRSRHLQYEETDITADPQQEAEMIARAGRSSVPQVFIDGGHIGGYDELAALDRSGELARRLGPEAVDA